MTPRHVPHLAPECWAQANRALLAKILGEFAHEGLLSPRPLDDGATYEVATDSPSVCYRFGARRFRLDHWVVEPASIARWVDGEQQPPDAAALFIECRDALGLAPDMLALYLEEIANTLYSAAYKRAHANWSVDELVHADFQTIEAAMTEGHPAFVANNARVGFSCEEFAAHAPEAAQPVRLLWVAAHTSRAHFSTAGDRDIASHLAAELDDRTRARFTRQLEALGLDPGDYHFMPVHPWQWRNKLVFAFAGEIATRHLVHLGFAPNTYQAQQSIRTLFNRDVPTRCYVKTSLSILNMGFTRGLSPYYMAGTPAICDWVAELVDNDSYLRATGFSVLREVAAIGYRHPHFEAAVPKTDGANKMLAALWRESPLEHLEDGERLMTMAALMHCDYDGNALICALIRASGRTIDDWLEAYLEAYMSPLLHCFYAHDLVFMPHGENLILVLRDNVVERVIMKDIAEEVAVMDPAAPLPQAVARIAVPVPEELKTLSIFTDLFDLVFRYIAALLAMELDYPQERFWAHVAACIRGYQDSHPDNTAKYARYDLFAADFGRSCLNRLQLANNRQMLDLAEPTESLQIVGRLDNPIASWQTCARPA